MVCEGARLDQYCEWSLPAQVEAALLLTIEFLSWLIGIRCDLSYVDPEDRVIFKFRHGDILVYRF